MTPNLTRLFDETKDGSHYAPVILGDLFAAHGEALIAALEEMAEQVEMFYACVTCNHEAGVCICEELAMLENAKQLLAQLEAEAQR